ncbi:hypothetical protein NE237_022281 [Protea cynaroides]|uniref:Uncharacterized protein n=1 Tax=Protea cynaroides TaxID=273540 RepID=A0A9Q0K4B2_9MAGN|nr:hypothetical protein NE237_022281 [Protea cynaroides]
MYKIRKVSPFSNSGRLFSQRVVGSLISQVVTSLAFFTKVSEFLKISWGKYLVMGDVYKELDEVKIALEKIKEDCRIKTELSESLRKTHNEQLIKLQEAKSWNEKQAQELNAKADEISLTRQKYEDLKSCLSEKESVLLHLRSANDKLRADSAEKLHKLEEENRELFSALDEANAKRKDQEEKIIVYKQEIEHLKGLLSVSQKKHCEAEQRAQVSKDLRQRDDLLQEQEEKSRKIEEQLKWKKEQFQHLEEAHGKLQDQYVSSKREWEQEKSMLLDELSSLQTNLDSQTRISKDLQARLDVCNQALAHEESRRKFLEVQLFETKTCYENVFIEYQEAKSKIEDLAIQRDNEVATLRSALGKKETLFKEMEFRKSHLEQENQELQKYVKELQEDQISKAAAPSSLTRLRNKLKSLEQVHKECSTNLKTRESEWSSKMDKTTKELNDLRTELNSKNTHIEELHYELEGCYSSMLQLMLHNEEISVMLILLQSGLSEACTKLSNVKVEIGVPDKDTTEQIASLMGELEKKNVALVEAHAKIEQERENAASLVRRIEPLDLFEQQNLVMQNELQRCKEMLEESSGCQLRLKEEAMQMQNALKEDLRNVSEALDKTNSELMEKIRESSEIEFELEMWKSVAERLKGCVDENQEIRREMEASLLAQAETEQALKQEKRSFLQIVEEKDQKIDTLDQQIILLRQQYVIKEAETSTLMRMEAEKAFKQEKESFLQVAEEKEKSIRNLQKEIAWLEQEFMSRELESIVLARTKAEKTFEEEKDRILCATEEKDKSIENFQQLIMSMKHDFERSVEVSILSGLAKKQAEVDILHKAWDKITMAKLLAEVEIQQMNFLIVELEGEISNLQQKLESQEKYLSTSKLSIEQLEAALQEKQSETETLMGQLLFKLKASEGLIKELSSERSIFVSDIMKLSSEKEELRALIKIIWDHISEFSREDAKLMARLGVIVQSFDNENEVGMDLPLDDEIYDPSRENLDGPLAPTGKSVELCTDGRSPLKELNN